MIFVDSDSQEDLMLVSVAKCLPSGVGDIGQGP